MKPRLWNLKSKWIQEMKDKNRDDVEIYYYFENICELPFRFCYLIFLCNCSYTMFRKFACG